MKRLTYTLTLTIVINSIILNQHFLDQLLVAEGGIANKGQRGLHICNTLPQKIKPVQGRAWGPPDSMTLQYQESE